MYPVFFVVLRRKHNYGQKTVENDGYSAVQVGFADKKEKVVSKDATGKKEIRKEKR